MHDLPPLLTSKIFRNVIARGPKGGVYLTFDDGPDPVTTTNFLRILAALNCRATFFVTGRKVSEHPAVAREIVEAGQDIGLHGFGHKSMLLFSPERALADIDKGLKAIEQACGVKPNFFRPPYGRIGPGVIDAARELGLKVILWSLSGRDWVEQNPQHLASKIVDSVKDGDIILLHDSGPGSESSLNALPEIVKGIRSKGLRLAPLDSGSL